MGGDWLQKVGGNLIDPFRIVSTASKGLTGRSGESWLGMGSKGDSPSAIPSMPTAPVAGGSATEAEKSRIRKKTKTILSSPLVGDEYSGSAPTLLGGGDTTKKNTLG